MITSELKVWKVQIELLSDRCPGQTWWENRTVQAADREEAEIKARPILKSAKGGVFYIGRWWLTEVTA